KLAFVAIPILLAASPLSGQQLPARLTLEDAIRIAESRSPDYRQAAIDLDQAEISERRVFRNTFFPQITGGLSFSARAYRTYTAQNFDGSDLPQPLVNTGQGSTSSQSLGMAMTLFDGPSFYRLRQARITAEQTQGQVSANLFSVRAEITRRFY